MPAFLFAERADAEFLYSQQGIATSSQHSVSQQGDAAKAAADARAKVRTARSFFMWILEMSMWMSMIRGAVIVMDDEALEPDHPIRMQANRVEAPHARRLGDTIAQ